METNSLLIYVDLVSLKYIIICCSGPVPQEMYHENSVCKDCPAGTFNTAYYQQSLQGMPCWD